MNAIAGRRVVWVLPIVLVLIPAVASSALGQGEEEPGLVRCANLVYARDRSSVCFADHFLAEAREQTHIRTDEGFTEVHSESEELYNYPFAVMTGQGAFTLTQPQRENLRRYLRSGGFLLASAGCSSEPWRNSFRREIQAIFPEAELEKLPLSHPIFHTVFDIDELKTKRKGVTAELEALTIEGRVVCIYSPDGLNDTRNAGGDCCCCGGNEILNAKRVNVNILAYALTH